VRRYAPTSVPDATQLFQPIAAVPLVREIALEVTEGPGSGKSFGPIAPPLRIGSALGNDVVLEDPTVSRFHCAIDRSADGLFIQDSGSKNGTFVGGVRIREAYLKDGVQVRLGQSTLVVKISAQARPVEMSAAGSFGALIGDSRPMRTLFAVLARLAKADAPVLIEGETGSGKELVARALHSEGPRAQKPFVVVDCGAVAPTLIESELFGHAKGAFTGAEVQRKGAFELADGGTIFLDEIGELPLPLQPKLLRALETGTIKALGSGVEKSVSVRVVAATHRDLRQMVNEGRFREDLYFRLAVCPVHVPPLRDRPEDIPILARHYFDRAKRAASDEGAPVPPLSQETITFLRTQSWPGNVRELRNAIERAVILGDPSEVAVGELVGSLREQSLSERRADRSPVQLEEAKRRFEREYLIKLLSRYPNDNVKAAEEAGLHPKSLQRLVRRHGLRKGAEGEPEAEEA
jgi:DNA-binding NtrC family response regulator